MQKLIQPSGSLPQPLVLNTPSNDLDASPLEGNGQSVPILVRPTTPLSWKDHILNVKKVQIHPGIKQHMDYDLGFANWVNSLIVQVVTSGSIQTMTCLIPDQFDIGVKQIWIEPFDYGSRQQSLSRDKRGLVERVPGEGGVFVMV